MRIIPGKTKIKIELFKGIGLADLLIGLVCAGLIILTLTSTFTGRLYAAAALLFIGVMLLVKIGDEPNYVFFLSILRHVVYRKSYSKQAKGKKNMKNINAFTGIEDGLILYDEYYGAAIEIPPVEFRFFSGFRRSMSIDECLANVLRSLHGSYAANLVKIERKVPYDGYIRNERDKLDELRHCFECALITEEEYQAKCEVSFDRIHELEAINSENRIVAPYYYLVFFDSDKNQLRMQVESAVSVLERGEMKPKRLNSKELALFLKYTNDLDFDEKELDALEEKDYAAWAMPDSLKIRDKNYVLDDMTAYTMAVSNYPMRVGDAWLAGVMSIPATKVVVKFQPMDKVKTIRNIDRSISELQARYNHSGVNSTLIELSEHIKSLSELLSMLQSDNEVLLNTDIYVTCYDVPLTKREGRTETAEKTSRANISNMRSVIRRHYREADIRLSSLQFSQMEGYVGSQVSGYDPLVKTYGRGIPGTTAAAMFPWIYAHVQDPKGVKLGSEDGVPVFIDLFRRDSERVNSNIVIVGKSGSGKSYAAKSILVNLAADNSKIFVLDPENEYTELAENLHGKFINVGNAQQGRINPFHIITALDDDVDTGSDDAAAGTTGSYASHMQFLEEFFKQILPDCNKDALEYLNTITDRVYMNRGITQETNLSLLSPTDYPTFEDLYDEILKEFQSNDNEYIRTILRTLMNYVSKFSTGGRNANIWNGPSTITTEENFTVFNFQSLLSGGNQTVTNAQMLLVMKYIDNEIIKNREYNNRYGTHRKIVVVIDEAHVFIDDKYPIALDFMFQLAKRIRKYNGMQIVITQNIKDFVGSEEISRKSSAIINACQYSFIFPLAPNDMDDLCKLYEKAGGINENEQEKIIMAPRGNAFVILSPTSRSSFQMEVPHDVVQVFRKRGAGTRYFNGEEGRAAWDEYLGDSRQKFLSNRKIREIPATAEEEHTASGILFTEISEEDYERERSEAEEKQRLSFQFVEETGGEPAVTLTEIPTEAAPPAPVTAFPAIPTASLSSTVANNGELSQVVSELRRMVDSMGRFSYDAMVSDIMSRLGTVSAAAPAQPTADAATVSTSTATAEAPAAAPETEVGEDMGEADHTSFDLFNFLTDVDEEAAEEETRQQSAEAAAKDGDDEDYLSLANYLRTLASEEENEAPIVPRDEPEEADREEETDLPEEIDIMSILSRAASDLQNISVLEDMESLGEKKRIITLEELTMLNEIRKNR